MRRLLPILCATLLPTSALATELPFTAQGGLGALAAADDVDYGDFDGDGDLDVVAVDTGSDTIVWIRNVDGTAANATTISTATLDTVRFVRVGDMDNDGDLDVVVVAAGTADEVRVYWNSNNTWTTSNLVVSRNGPTGLEIGDLDQDGDLDIVMGRSNGDLYWYANGRSPSAWVEATITSVPADAAALTLADIDGDSDLDLVAAIQNNGSGAGQIQWYENDLENTTTWTLAVVNAENLPSDVAAADVDGDGDQDIVAVMDSGSGDDVRLYENTNGEGTAWTISTIAATLAGAERVDLTDLDADGDPDVITGSGTATWYESAAGATSWTPHLVAGSTGGGHVVAADFGGDGDLDLLITGTAGVGVAINVRLHPELTTSVGGTTSGTATQVFASLGGEAVDIDGDGDLDFVYGGRGTPNNLQWLENDNWLGGSFTEHLIYNGVSGNNLIEARPGDANLDGLPDVFTVGGQGDLEILATHVAGGGGPLWSVTTALGDGGDSPRGIDLADIDADGDLDFLIAAFNHDDVNWLRNNRTSSNWTAFNADLNLDGATSIFGADINRDGGIDIARPPCAPRASPAGASVPRSGGTTTSTATPRPGPRRTAAPPRRTRSSSPRWVGRRSSSSRTSTATATWTSWPRATPATERATSWAPGGSRTPSGTALCGPATSSTSRWAWRRSGAWTSTATATSTSPARIPAPSGGTRTAARA